MCCAYLSRRSTLPPSMTALSDLLQATPRSITPTSTAAAFIHIVNPKRRALIRAIGFEDVSVGYLRTLYGPSWGAVQADLRALVDAELIEVSGMGMQARFSLDLSNFPPGVLNGILTGNQQVAFAA